MNVKGCFFYQVFIFNNSEIKTLSHSHYIKLTNISRINFGLVVSRFTWKSWKKWSLHFCQMLYDWTALKPQKKYKKYFAEKTRFSGEIKSGQTLAHHMWNVRIFLCYSGVSLNILVTVVENQQEAPRP